MKTKFFAILLPHQNLWCRGLLSLFMVSSLFFVGMPALAKQKASYYVYWAQEEIGYAATAYPIYKMRLDGTQQTRMPLDSAESLSVSPNGKWYALAEGGGAFIVKVYNKATAKSWYVQDLGVSHHVSWSPNSKKIIFTSENSEGDIGFVGKICTANRKGKNITTITPRYGVDGSSLYPHFSPNGKKILFELKKYPSQRHVVCLMSSKGKNVKCPTADLGVDSVEPVFSPNGKTIAFARNDGGVWNIWKMTLKTKKMKQLTTLSDSKHPVFSPNGKKIYFQSNRDDGETWEIYVMNRDGSKEKRLTNNSVNDISPSAGK